jgi:CHAT domain-containing protein
LGYFNQVLPILRVVGNRRYEASTLNNIGRVYADLAERQKGLEYLEQALPLSRAVGDRAQEAITLVNIGRIYAEIGEKHKALDYYNQALPLMRAVGDRASEAKTLSIIGLVYDDLGEKQKALDYYTQSLPLSRAVQNPLSEASTLVHMMEYWKSLRNPSLAVLFGKQAIDLFQQVRRNIGGLERETQQSFLKSKEDYYRDLADLLIAQGRLPEAQQVLDLLKEQEYSDYVRGEAANTLSPLTLTPAEKEADEDYQKSTAQLVSLGEQWAELKKITARTAEQEKQYKQLSDQLDAASKGLNDYYARLYVLFGKNSDANKQVADVKGDVSLLKQTIAKMPHTVALYTLVGKDRTSLIVVTGTATVAREYAIPEADLNKKVAEFEQVLRDPAKDPKPLAQELYRILIGPVKADLDQARAETLVWSLDGVLRYVPMAALYDGKQYVVENYNTVTITPASIAHLAEKPEVSNLSAAAMGISRKYEDGLSALPAVEGELDDVVKDPQVQAAHGILPGTILLNGQFTEKAMEDQLGGQHTVVHIASHFVFKPGDDSQSYLLLAGKGEGGAGFHLTVADFRDNQKLALDDTDLLTLSACETGMSGSASNGREVDGLGTTAQLKGAKAVISSLWEVDDASTGELMGDFYKRWAEGKGKVTKVEALREAQLDLLMGRVKPKADSAGRGMGRVLSEAPAGYAHPYYWAPFVLMGNWR